MKIDSSVRPSGSSDCFAVPSEDELTVDAALDLIEALPLPKPQCEVVPLRSALSRILAEDLRAPFDLPRYDSAAMDGFAIRFADLPPQGEAIFPVTGRAAAGHPHPQPVARGAAVRIFTGAPIPAGLDTIIMQEHCRVQEGRVALPVDIKPGANLRRAGEDIRTDEVALRAGRRLRPQDLAIAAALGFETIPVFRRPRVALFSTGDELRDMDAPLDAGSVYDANRYAIGGLLEEAGCQVTDLGILGDDPGLLVYALERAALTHDVIVTSGGMSGGEEDRVKAAVLTLGRLHFWRLPVKPGRPVALGQIGEASFIGLPGNPVSAIVTFMIIARPLLHRLAGATDIAPTILRARANFRHSKSQGRREYLRVFVSCDHDGDLIAEKHPRQGSHILTSLIASNGLAIMVEEATTIEPGDLVDFMPFANAMIG